MSIMTQDRPVAGGRRPRLLGMLIGPFAGVRIDFGEGAQQKKLTITFNFISGLISRVIVLTFAWAVAAGVLQTGRLLLQLDGLAPRSVKVWDWIPAFGHEGQPWFVILSMWPVYTLKAFGVAMALFVAAACVGAVVGFLFGVPRPISEGAVPSPAVDGGSAVPRTGADRAAVAKQPAGLAPSWQANTNLTQISD